MKPVCFLILISFVFSYSLLFSQIDDSVDYELLLAEAQLILLVNAKDGFQASLMDSASVYAARGEFEIAKVFLESMLLTFKDLKDNENAKDGESWAGKDFSFTILTGVDYNRNEFELGLTQNDSVIFDEIQKPFVGMNFAKKLLGKRDLLMEITARYDKENITGEAGISNAFRNNQMGVAYNANMTFDENRLYPEFSFWSAGSRQNLDLSLNRRWKMRANNQLQFKKYKNPSQQVPTYFRDYFNVEIQTQVMPSLPVRMMYQIDYNESIKYVNNDFLEHLFQLNGDISHRTLYRNSVILNYRRNRFVYALEDSVFKNRSQTLQLDTRNVINLNNNFGLHIDYSIKNKKYHIKTEQDPDYIFQEFNTYIRYLIGTQTSVEAGGSYENQLHRESPGINSQYIKIQDYSSKGLLIGFEYSNFPKYLISMHCSFNQKRYPNTSDDVLSIYTDRDVLTLHLLIQVPVYRNLNLNIFGSYDSDRDLDIEESRIHTTFFSAELSYSF